VSLVDLRDALGLSRAGTTEVDLRSAGAGRAVDVMRWRRSAGDGRAPEARVALRLFRDIRRAIGRRRLKSHPQLCGRSEDS
jgi:hypothetical protein